MRVLVVVNTDNGQARDAAVLLSAYFSSQLIDCVIFASDDLPPWGPAAGYGLPAEVRNDPRFQERFDLAVVLGGDGTILRTARMVASYQTPIIGLNFGHLGFLADTSEEGVIEPVAAALAGEVIEERRTNLQVDVICDDGCVLSEDDARCVVCMNEGCYHPVSPEEAEAGQRPSHRSFFALNEVSIARGSSGHIVDFEMNIAGESVARMRGDGVVVSSATGSTAYALSAGGPLVAPGFEGLVVVPLAPHTLVSRAIVTAKSDVVEINLAQDSHRHEIALFTDGNLLALGSAVRRVIVRRGMFPTVLLRSKQGSFYRKTSDVFFRDARCN